MTSRRAVPPILLVLLTTRAVSAQTSPAEVARRDILQQADTARAAGDHTRALDLARRAAQIRMTTSLRLLLAQESEATEDHVAALDHATACVREAEADAALRNREQILVVCRALVTSVTPRVGRIVVNVSSPPAGLVVRVAGHEVSDALYGLPFPVAPGEVSVEVSGDGITPSRETVRVPAGAQAEVTPRIRVVVRRDDPSTTRSSNGAMRVPAGSTNTTNTGPGAGPWVLVGLGAASAAVGGVLLAMASGYHSDSDKLCPQLVCQSNEDIATARGLDSNFVTFSNTGVGALVAGGAVLAAGLLWYAVAPRGETQRAVSWSIVPSASGAMLGVGGSL